MYQKEVTMILLSIKPKTMGTMMESIRVESIRVRVESMMLSPTDDGGDADAFLVPLLLPTIPMTPLMVSSMIALAIAIASDYVLQLIAHP